MPVKKPVQTKQSKVHDYHYYIGSTGASHSVKTGNVSQLLVKFLLGLFVVFFLFSLAGLYHTIRLSYFNALVAFEEHKEQKLISRIQHVDSQLKKLQEEYVKVYTIEDNLRLVHGLAPIDQELRLAGAGGQPTIPFITRELLGAPALKKLSSLQDSLDNLSRKISLLNHTKQLVYDKAQRNSRYYSQIPTIWPTRGSLSSHFGSRFHPVLGRRQMHNGIDISNRTGTKIYAPADGTIKSEGWDGAYGIMVAIRHPQTGYETRFAHMSRTAVEGGQRVQRGDLIGYMGNTGRSTGPHLHYEVRKHNNLLNPMSSIPHPTLVVE